MKQNTFAVQSCEDEVRKAKANLKLNLRRGVKGDKKGFYECMNSKGKTRESVSALLNRAGELLAKGVEEAQQKVLSASSASVFIS